MENPPALPPDICILGETNLDLILYGLPEEMPVEREILGNDFRLTLGGSSAILAHNLSLLGTRVHFTTLVGDDEMGSIALGILEQAGLETTKIMRRTDKGTGVTILLPHGRKRHILTYPGVMAEMTVADLDLAALTSARHFHLSSLFLQPALHPGLPALFDLLRHSGLTLSLDTNDDPADTWSGILDLLLDRIDLFLPNEDEILRITRTTNVDDALTALAPRVPTIAVKCGVRGARVQHQGERRWIAPNLVDSARLIDTIGAGDSFNAGFLHSTLLGHDPFAAAAFGNLTGALSTQRPGGVEAFRDKTFRNEFITANQPSLA